MAQLVTEAITQHAGPRLYVTDRQFCDLKIPRRIAKLEQFFVIRYRKKMSSSVEREQVVCDQRGCVVRDAWGRLGSAEDPRSMRLPRITLERPWKTNGLPYGSNLPPNENFLFTPRRP